MVIFQMADGYIIIQESKEEAEESEKFVGYNYYWDVEAGLIGDFTIETKDGEVRCHGGMLRAVFPYFKGLFEMNDLLKKDTTKTKLDFLDHGSIKKLVKFAYTDDIDLVFSEIEHLVEAAGYFQSDKVTKECDKYIAARISPGRSMKWYELSSKYNLHQTLKVSYRQALKFFTFHIHRISLKQLHPNNLQSLLNDDRLNVENEDLVIEALLEWCSHEPSERSEITQELLAHVRFNY